MKEFQSTTGGRHAYNTDFKNLQELALAMQEIFRECGGNFVISGCDVTVDSTISVSEGYVYIGNRVCKVAAASGLQAANLYIVAKQKNGDTIPYADGNSDIQYIDYYAEVVNSTSVNSAYIAYNSSSKAFPNLATMYFNYYTVCKKAGSQSIDNLTVQQTLTALKQLLVPQGVQFDSSATKNISVSNTDVIVHNGQYDLGFNASGIIYLKQDGAPLFSFSNTSGTGLVTFGSATVQAELRTKKLYIDGIDIEQKQVPLGTVQMWAGPIDKVPSNYALCDGGVLSIADYAELYAVIGTTFNTAPNPYGVSYTAPSDTQFRLPDLRGRFINGYCESRSDYNAIGKVGGQDSVTLSESQIPSHTHSFDDYYFMEEYNSVLANPIYGSYKPLGSAKSYMGSYRSDTDNNTLLYTTHATYSSGGSSAHENRPPYYVLAYIMRIK